jgi:FtsP/CotA-like multicopper oxidase with cupredoxin domain/peroxiredoxin
VSPEGSSDNVYLEIGPEQTKGFCFDVPATHTPGTFWYHAHRHGSTALQLTSGMAGPLIIEGGLDTVPEIAEAMKHGREKVLVFQQITYSLNAQQVGEVTKQDVYPEATRRLARLAKGEQFEATLINGIHYPVIKMKPGEVQRWRCVHAGILKAIPLALVKEGDEKAFLPLYEIARDGLPLYRMEEQPSLKLYPGYRSDFLVKAPRKAGKYLLKGLSLPRAEALGLRAQEEEYLARVEVEGGQPLLMNLPPAAVIGDFALQPVDGAELANRRPIPFVFRADENKQEFVINEEAFDHDRVAVCPRLGTAEEWALSSAGDTHPFHIHVNPFEVIEKDETGRISKRYWRDTIVLLPRNAPDAPIYVRMRFQTFPGKTVLHCHNLRHEDQGMMMAVRIVGKAPPSRCDPNKRAGVGRLPARAPEWRLPDGERRTHRLTHLAGHRLLLVFIRGLGCAHCRRQLEALALRRQDLEAAKLTVVAVTPDPPSEAHRALREGALPFRVLCDVPLDTFRRYGCFDGGVLHGTFLIDRRGLVHWQQVGEEPYLDIDTLLREARGHREEVLSGGR